MKYGTTCFFKRIIGLALAVLLTSCAAPTALPAVTPTAPNLEANELNIYNWDTYIDPTIITDFEQRYGVKINYDVFGSNEELLERVESGQTDYDLVVPSDYMVSIMREKNLLAPLEKENIPNIRNISPEFTSPNYDPGNQYCAPYQWGTVGIGYNINSTGRTITGWKDLFDPGFRGRVSMLDDSRLSLGVVLLYLGYSPNTTHASQIAEARDFLINRADQISAYAPDTGQDLLAAAEVDLAFEWSGDIFQLISENPDIRYIIPEEGSIIWTDNICILATAPHQGLAEIFINYLLEPRIGATLSNYIRFSSPNEAALPYINESDRNDPALYPPEEVRRRLFFVTDVGAEADALYQQAWAEVMASKNP